jgi:aspartyl-tRNA(Asn)/glutamyl-tRNA(Gln) amidotransferase subunit B
MCLIYQDKINSSAGQKILEKMYWEGGDPNQIMQDLGLEQMDSSEELTAVVKTIVDANPTQVAQYRAGKTNVFQFFIGQAMAATKGKANPKIVKEILEKLLQ